jgi:hypothetical protein
MSNDLRFSRNKRLFRNVTFTELVESMSRLANLVQEIKPSIKIEVVTCENLTTYAFSTVTFDTDEVISALSHRKTYALEQFTIDVWKRSHTISLSIWDDSDPKPFMICVSCDRKSDAGRMMFYGQCLDEKMHKRILDTFAKPDLFCKIGDGFPKLSVFNTICAAKMIDTSLT